MHCPLKIRNDTCCNEGSDKWQAHSDKNRQKIVYNQNILKYDTGWYWHNFRYLNVDALDKPMQSICYIQNTSRKQKRYID